MAEKKATASPARETVTEAQASSGAAATPSARQSAGTQPRRLSWPPTEGTHSCRCDLLISDVSADFTRVVVAAARQSAGKHSCRL